MTSTVGARYATVTAPSVIAPGSTATVGVTVVNDGDYAMPGARFSLAAPRGWTVTPAGPAPGTIGPGQTVTASFHVTPPANAAAGSYTLTAKVSYGGPSAGLVEASATVAVPYTSLAAAYNNAGISNNSDEAAANYDGVGDSFSAQALALGTPNALTQGGQVTVGGTTFTWPDAAPGTPDNVVTGGQTVELSGSGTDLGIPRREPERDRLRHRHGQLRRRQQPVIHPEHGGLVRRLAAALGNQLVTTTSSWNFQSNPLGPHPVSIYFASVPLQPGKQVASVTLPVLSGAGGTTAMHVFAMATGTGTPTTGAPFSSLAAAVRQRRDHR